MKMYIAPEFEKITCDAIDVITASITVKDEGDIPEVILPLGTDEGTIFSDN